jgi:hypothetical protein
MEQLTGREKSVSGKREDEEKGGRREYRKGRIGREEEWELRRRTTDSRERK